MFSSVGGLRKLKVISSLVWLSGLGRFMMWLIYSGVWY